MVVAQINAKYNKDKLCFRMVLAKIAHHTQNHNLILSLGNIPNVVLRTAIQAISCCQLETVKLASIQPPQIYQEEDVKQ